MRKFFVLFLLALMYSNAFALKYYTGIGLRAGKFNTGLTFKHFYNPDNATGLQLDAYYSNIISGGYIVKGFAIKQIPVKIPIIQLPLDIILGAGLEVGYFPYRKDPVYIGYYKLKNKRPEQYGKSVVVAGVDATVQVEYQVPFKIAPVTVGLDVNPFFMFYHRGPEWIDFGVALRYVFR